MRRGGVEDARRGGEQHRVEADAMACAHLPQPSPSPDIASSVSVHRAIRRRAGVAEQPPRAAPIVFEHEDAARQEAQRALDRAHVPVGDEIGQAGAVEQRFDEGDQHKIVGAHEFVQGSNPEKARNLPRDGRLSMFRARRIGKEELPVGQVIPLEEKSADRLIEPLTDLVAADMALVNKTILSRTGSDVTMIPEVANHLISSGGKRLRPILTLATAALTGYRGDGHIKLAAAVEFMHTATLLHDDVVDDSDMRRGKAAARVVWGNQASVLVGDFLLGQAFKMMVEVGSLPCAGRAVERRGGHRRGRGDAALRRQGHRDDRGRLSRRHPRQDGGAVLGGLRGRADPRQAPEGGDRGLPRLRRQSRRRLSA